MSLCYRRRRNSSYLVGWSVGFQKGKFREAWFCSNQEARLPIIVVWLQGNQNLSQHMMRARVVAQVISWFARLLLACCFVYSSSID